MHAKQNVGTLNLSSCMNVLKISNKNRQGMVVQTSFGMWLCTFDKFEAIFEQMPGELMVHKSS